MFLNELNSQEKELFMDLCIHAAKSNGIYDEDERVMVNVYCNEMGIEEPNERDVQPLNKVIEMISLGANEKSKKIMTLEILGLIHSDGIYDNEEKEFMNQFIHKIDVSEETLNEMISKIQAYQNVCKDLFSVIEG